MVGGPLYWSWGRVSRGGGAHFSPTLIPWALSGQMLSDSGFQRRKGRNTTHKDSPEGRESKRAILSTLLWGQSCHRSTFISFFVQRRSSRPPIPEFPQAQSLVSLPLSSKDCSSMHLWGRQRQGKREGHAQQWELLTVLCRLHRLHTFEATVPVTALLRTLTVPVSVTLGWLSPDAAHIVRWANAFFLLVVEEATR